MDIHEAQLWMQQHAMTYLKAGNFLYRGLQRQAALAAGGLLFADSNEGKPRKSVGGMANYYTLWMSHNPKWKGLPRREHSFITSSSIDDASSWGLVHLVIPADDATIGAVGANDIWNRTIGKDLTIAGLTDATKTIFEYFGSTSIINYDDLVGVLKVIKLDLLVSTREKGALSLDSRVIRLMKTHGVNDLFELWEVVFDPKNFRFMSTKNISGEGEFWIDGKALFIPFRHNFEKSHVTDMILWAEDYAPHLAKKLKKHWDYEEASRERVDPDTVSNRDTLTYSKKKR